MSDEARREAARWLRYIDADLTAIRLALSTDPPVGLVAGYRCQQAAEKIMKGPLVLDDQPFRRTHDLDELADGVLRMRPELRDRLAPLRLLTAWGYMYRYPGFDEPADPSRMSGSCARPSPPSNPFALDSAPCCGAAMSRRRAERSATGGPRRPRRGRRMMVRRSGKGRGRRAAQASRSGLGRPSGR